LSAIAPPQELTRGFDRSIPNGGGCLLPPDNGRRKQFSVFVMELIRDADDTYVVKRDKNLVQRNWLSLQAK
jgi:hypothetical protein